MYFIQHFLFLITLTHSTSSFLICYYLLVSMSLGSLKEIASSSSDSKKLSSSYMSPWILEAIFFKMCSIFLAFFLWSLWALLRIGTLEALYAFCAYKQAKWWEWTLIMIFSISLYESCDKSFSVWILVHFSISSLIILQFILLIDWLFFWIGCKNQGLIAIKALY